MIVYIVTTGCYSDTAIRGAYSDKATAERVAKMIDPNDGDVVEVDVDADPAPEHGWKRYGLTISFDGNVSNISDDEWAKELATEVTRHFEWPPGPWPKTKRDLDALRITCWAADVDHAIKIANERRVRWLVENADRPAEGEGGERG